MTCAKSMDFCLRQGDDLRVVVDVVDQSGAVVDITGSTNIRWSAARSVNGTPLIEKVLGADLSINSPTSFFFDLLADETELLSGGYYHEAEIINDQDLIYTVMSGKMTVRPTLIKPE